MVRVLGDVTPGNVVHMYQHFEGTCCSWRWWQQLHTKHLILMYSNY